MTPGTSALVLLSVDAAIDTVARAFEGYAMELMRSDLSEGQRDRLRAAFTASRPIPGTDPAPPPGPRTTPAPTPARAPGLAPPWLAPTRACPHPGSRRSR